MTLIERIERVKKFLLRARLVAAQEVNIVDHQHIHVPVAISELIHIAAADGVNKPVDKIAGEIQNHVRLVIRIFWQMA